MLVKSLSHTPAVIVEYNRVKYMFTNDGKPVDIPVEALINAYKSGHIHSQDLVPVEQDTKELNAEIKLLKEENTILKKEVEELERKVKKGKK